MLKYFTISELCTSNTAERLGLANDPPVWVIRNLEELIRRILDPLRESYGRPIYVNSGYRSIPVNNAIKGAANSQHLKGQAADIRGANADETYKIWLLAKDSTLPYDQLINEKPDAQGRPTWIHISYARNPRKQILILA